MEANGVEKSNRTKSKRGTKTQFSKSIASVQELVDTLENKFFNTK